MDIHPDKLQFSNREKHKTLNVGDKVTAHWIFGHHSAPTEHSAAAEVLQVDEHFVTVRITADVPAAGEFPGSPAHTTTWAIPHECWHPHPRVEPQQ